MLFISKEFNDIEFESVERVYVPFTHRIKRGYKNLLLEAFLSSSGVKNMDFSDGPVAVEKINSWMNESTNGKVDSVVAEGELGIVRFGVGVRFLTGSILARTESSILWYFFILFRSNAVQVIQAHPRKRCLFPWNVGQGIYGQ